MDDAKVWERLGELTSEAKASQSQRSALFIKMEGVESSIANLTTIVEKSIVSSDLRLEVVEEDMFRMT